MLIRWLTFVSLLQATLCCASAQDEPYRIALSAFYATELHLAELDATGKWKRTTPQDIEFSGTFHLKQHPGKLHLKTRCTSKKAHGDTPLESTPVPDVVIMVDDGATLAVNVFGALAGPRPCLLKVHDRNARNRRNFCYHLRADLSHLAAFLNPKPIREDVEHLKRVGDALVSKTAFNAKLWRIVRLTPESGYNVKSWEVSETDTGEVVGGTEMQWENTGGGWQPTKLHHWTIADNQGGKSTLTLIFDRIVVGYKEQKGDYSKAALELCPKGLVVDQRSTSAPANHRSPAIR